jgi:hypothetical protein
MEHAMNPQIIEAGDYHVTCIGYPTANGKFKSIAKFERSSDWKQHVEAEQPQMQSSAMAHRLDPEFDNEQSAVHAAATYARSAVQGGGVLWFDEADALFGKRTEVKDSHDRY